MMSVMLKCQNLLECLHSPLNVTNCCEFANWVNVCLIVCFAQLFLADAHVKISPAGKMFNLPLVLIMNHKALPHHVNDDGVDALELKKYIQP